jgi:hypothetical protein
VEAREAAMNGAARLNNKVLSIEEVLAEEVEAIHGEKLTAEVHNQDAQEKRTRLNKDQRELSDPDARGVLYGKNFNNCR